MQWIFSLTKESDAFCISELRMDRRTFEILCDMLHHILLKTPEPISESCEDDKWKPFKGCLGALDGTFIPMTPPKEEKQRYRTRKGGSAHDDRVLRDAISRPTWLKVPQGCYYLVDAGYCNSSGFLASYRGHRILIKFLKGRYHAINEMCKQSGCSWNDVEKKIASMGDVAEDPLAAEQNLGNVDVTLTVTDESDSNTEIEFLSTMESLSSNSSSSCAAKKKCPHQVHKASKKTKFTPVKIAETEYTTLRMPQVLELLEKHGFSGPDKYKASKVICQDPLNVDLLFSLDSTEVYILLLIVGFALRHFIFFVSEHIETLEEIDVEYKELALKSGIENWGRVPTLGCEPTFISDLADVVIESLPYVGAMAASNIEARQ
ncbi:hypothetical protein ZIOFF_006783 [Zingiber officinale]|uniref:DDE Tnp4 domain-containing protein n=1 Tax=Zingiber officinale TaxID=94328 RepID=A0A8J5IEZ3_ZINOF|nr:hypothetical protein ZIOFF_006783 [Zingiber officinale]